MTMTAGLSTPASRCVAFNSGSRHRNPLQSCVHSKQPKIGARSKQARLVVVAVADADSKRVVILGGGGRIGASTAVALTKSKMNIDLVLAGRNRSTVDQAMAENPELQGAAFEQCDVKDRAAVERAIAGADLVVHCAGPFQGEAACGALEAAIAAKVPYVDVCDDTAYAARAKGLHQQAVEAGVPAVTTCGVFPGLSNVMAAEMIRLGQQAGRGDAGAEGGAEAEEAAVPTRLDYSYFTAGTGGAGPSTLATSLLLCGSPCTVFKDGQPMEVPAMSNRRVVDFGPGVNSREVFCWDLPEIGSSHHHMNVPTVTARFGTSPGIWNGALAAVAGLVPKGMLENRDSVQPLLGLASPLVRLTDSLVGEKIAMRVDLEMSNGTKPGAVYVHNKMTTAVGIATAAFARVVLDGEAQPGVHYPEEDGAVADRGKLIDMATAGASNFKLNQAAWALESDPIDIGFGIFWNP